MKVVECEIQGIVPLLQNRFPEEEHGAEKSRKKKKVYSPKEECEKAVYRDAKKNIVHPSEHIFGALKKAAVYFKFEGKKTFKDVIMRGIVIEPELIPLGKKTWDEIDSRPVVIQRARVMAWRPRFNKWKLNFRITIIDDDNLTVPELKDILEKAGTIGIGDYRPRFGRFMVSHFKEVKG